MKAKEIDRILLAMKDFLLSSQYLVKCVMIQNLIKKVLRKWLKKKVYTRNNPLTLNIARFEWVYNSPLHEWRDRIWVLNNSPSYSVGEYDRCLKEYLEL